MEIPFPIHLNFRVSALEEEVLFETVQKRVVSRERKVAETWAVWVVDDCRELVPIQAEEWLREQVATVDVLGAFRFGALSRAGVATP